MTKAAMHMLCLLVNHMVCRNGHKRTHIQNNQCT